MQNNKENEVYLLAKMLLNDLLGFHFSGRNDYDMCNANIEELYKIAGNNKVDLYFMLVYSRHCKLPYFYKKLLSQRLEQRSEMIETASRIIGILKDLGYRATTFKTFTPLPTVPNDVDVLILDNISNKEFNRIVSRLTHEHNYMIFDKIPYAVSLHDKRKIVHGDPRIKDPYDIDLYHEIAANKIIYLNKRIFNRNATDTAVIEGYVVSTLKPVYELITQCVHSILPEQIYLLNHFLIVLSLLRNISKNELINEVKRLKVEQEVSLCLYVTYELLRALMNNSITSSIAMKYFNHGYYRINIKGIINILIKRSLRDSLFRKSLVEQIVSLLNPKNLRHVVLNIVERRVRKTY